VLTSALFGSLHASPISPNPQLVFSNPHQSDAPPATPQPHHRLGAGRGLAEVEEESLKGPVEPLRNLQVHHPPVVPRSRSCSVELLKHDFAFSYCTHRPHLLLTSSLTFPPLSDEPAIANYTPPHSRSCGRPGDWAAVVLNLTVASNGTQFDRLASLSLGNVESAPFLPPLFLLLLAHSLTFLQSGGRAPLSRLATASYGRTRRT
jgi:hypothetical protein